MGGGGGGGQPRAVAPTVNTDTVQHAGTQGIGSVGGTTGGKGGGGNPIPAAAPTQRPNQISFGGYGQQSPFGMTNPQTWGGPNVGQAVSGSGAVQNAFNPTQFLQSDQSVGGGGGGAPTPAATAANVAGSALNADEYANASPDTIAMNNLNTTGEGAQAGGLWSSIRGHGDQAGSSLATGTQSNVGLQDHAIALGENMPGLIGAGTNAVNNALNIAPQDPNQADARNAQEVSIARHTQNWAEQAPDTPITLSEYTGPTINNDDSPSHEEIMAQHEAIRQRNQELGYNQTPAESAAAAGFDMNDPSTWVSNSDSREKTSDNDGGSSGGSSGGK